MFHMWFRNPTSSSFEYLSSSYCSAIIYRSAKNRKAYYIYFLFPILSNRSTLLLTPIDLRFSVGLLVSTCGDCVLLRKRRCIPLYLNATYSRKMTSNECRDSKLVNFRVNAPRIPQYTEWNTVQYVLYVCGSWKLRRKRNHLVRVCVYAKSVEKRRRQKKVEQQNGSLLCRNGSCFSVPHGVTSAILNYCRWYLSRVKTNDVGFLKLAPMLTEFNRGSKSRVETETFNFCSARFFPIIYRARSRKERDSNFAVFVRRG